MERVATTPLDQVKDARWVLAPLRTLVAVAHTAFCSAFGLCAMALRLADGDWVMWNVGRRMWSKPMLRWVVGAKWSVEVHPATAKLAASHQGLVLVGNHTSLLDINAAFAAIPTPIVFLSKASIRKVPLLGRINEKAGTVFVERGNRASSEKAIAHLTKTLAKGRSVLVFPEGTRSKDGRLMPFKKGAFHLAAAAGAPIVPMHIEGTHAILPANGWTLRPVTSNIRVRIGAPLPSGDSVEETTKRAEEQVRALGQAGVPA